MTNTESVSDPDPVLVEAATRIRNTLARDLGTNSNITVHSPTQDGYENLSEPTFFVSVEITTLPYTGLEEDPEEITDYILSRTYLYNGTEYTLESRQLDQPQAHHDAHEIKGKVTVVEH